MSREDHMSYAAMTEHRMITKRPQAPRSTAQFLWQAAVAATLCVSLTASWAADDRPWQPIHGIPADLPTEEMFDVVRPMDDFEAATPQWVIAVGDQHAQATVHRDTTERHAGAASLRVDYDFVGKTDYEYIQLNGQTEFAEPGLGFGFWLKHDGTPFVVRLRFTDASGEWHQIDMLSTSQPGWQFFAGLVDNHSTAWGGDGNQRKDYPLKLAGICIDRPRVGFVGRGSLWLDDAAVLRPRAASVQSLQMETQHPRFGNLYAVGDVVTLRARGGGDQVRWRTVDFFGRELAHGEGAASGIEARFTCGEAGWYACRLELLDGGRVVDAKLFQCAALPGGCRTGSLGLRRRMQSFRTERISARHHGPHAALRPGPVPRRNLVAWLRAGTGAIRAAGIRLGIPATLGHVADASADHLRLQQSTLRP